MSKIKIIMKKTFVDNLSIKKTAIYTVFILITSYLFAFGIEAQNKSNMLFLDQQVNLVSNYFFTGFIWIVGIPYLLYLIILTAGTLSKEIESGTFLLIFTRPVKKQSIIIGKFLGLFFYLMLINAYILFLLPSLAGLFQGLSSSLVSSLYLVSIVLFVYSIFITFFIMALSFVLSTKIKKTIITSVVLFVVVLAIFLMPMLVTNISDKEVGYNLGYSFGSLGVNVLELSGLNLNPQIKNQFGSLTGVYLNKRDTPKINYPSAIQEPAKANLIPSSLNLMLIIISSLLLLYLSYIFLRKKEIY